MQETKATATSVKLVFPSVIQLVDLVHAATEKMAEFAGLDNDEALNVGLALREAVINAIVHGNGNDPERDVRVTLTVARRSLRATVQDEGSGFDPGAAPDPTAPTNLLNTSGRGLLLMRAFVDEVRFDRGDGRGMEITLIKKLDRPPAQGDAG